MDDSPIGLPLALSAVLIAYLTLTEFRCAHLTALTGNPYLDRGRILWDILCISGAVERSSPMTQLPEPCLTFHRTM